MSTTTAHRSRRRRLTAATAALVGLLAPLTVTATAAAADAPLASYEVEGRVVYRIADPLTHGEDEHEHEHEGEHAHESSVTTAYAEVDGALLDLSAVQAPVVGTEGAPADGIPAGSGVTVTIQAPAGLAQDEAVALAAGTDGEPLADEEVTEEATAEAEAALATAQVVDAVVTTPAPAEDATAALVSGAHQLVVIPVRWSASGTVPTADLQTAAAGTEEYWERQSNGKVDIRPVVRPAVTIARPGTCDVDTIMNRVIAATDITPTATRHVAVHFPEHPDCGFAGLATIKGGAIWLNGAAHTYVLAHELGHNFGLGHANTLECVEGSSTRVTLTDTGQCWMVEYGDDTDVMGQGRNLQQPGNLSSGFAQYLGWANVRSFASPVLSPTAVDLTPLSQYTGTRGIKLTSSWGPIFTDFRPAVGADALHRPAWAGVQARLIDTDPTFKFPTSYLLDLQPSNAVFANPSLPAGRSWEVPGAAATITTTSTGATARVTVGAPAEAARVQRYVSRVYQDLLGREPDAARKAGWTKLLLTGTPRPQVTAQLTTSDPYRSKMIADAYQTYLGRAVDSSGAASQLKAMRGGRTIQSIQSSLLASGEYYKKAGGTNSRWVTKLYQQVLGRTPSTAEVQSWTTRLGKGTTRQTVALSFLMSTEHLNKVVGGYYTDLLGRTVDVSGRKAHVTAIQRGTRIETIVAGLVGSAEYYKKS